jgi:sterol desaturase/sphingolipid hydroxylase (fatty acid hydroxylase superfamily)
MISIQAIGAFCIIFFGYITTTCYLQYLYYCRKAKLVESWKIQPKNNQHVNVFWGMPLFSSKPNRGPYHRFVVTINILMASCFAAFVAESSMRGWNKMTFEHFSTVSQGLSVVGFQILLASLYESVVEYYWHRLMHVKQLYKHFHKMHHHYKSPEPWDDMYIHPLEAFGYYCILYGAPFVLTMHLYSFIGYMMIMGTFGILDHCGVHFEIPFIYNTADHDNHHAKFEVNYSFPFIFMDILHDTFDGEYAGRKYKPKIERKSE